MTIATISAVSHLLWRGRRST